MSERLHQVSKPGATAQCAAALARHAKGLLRPLTITSDKLTPPSPPHSLTTSFICTTHATSHSFEAHPDNLFYPFPSTQTPHYLLIPTTFPRNHTTSNTMFAKASTLLAVFAVAARVAASAPPACLLAAVKYVAPVAPNDTRLRSRTNKHAAPATTRPTSRTSAPRSLRR